MADLTKGMRKSTISTVWSGLALQEPDHGVAVAQHPGFRPYLGQGEGIASGMAEDDAAG